MRRFGLDRHILSLFQKSFRRFPQIKHVLLFGSRARGDYKNYSDIDLAIRAPRMSPDDFGRLKSALDELPVIFRIDAIHLDAAHNRSLVHKIQRDGRAFYRPL